MKWTHGVASAIFGAGVWIFTACGGSDTPNNPTDGGTTSDAAGQPDASAGDAGSTGDLCATYCDTVAEHCKGDVSDKAGPRVATAQYLSRNGCLHACSKMIPGPVGAEEVTSGDSVRCRTYHAGNPALGDPATHCPHAGIAGAVVCSNEAGRCASFCRMALALCSPAALSDAGVAAPFVNEEDCLSVCGKSVPGGFLFDGNLNELVRTGNTLNCRQYHLAAAYNDAPDSRDGGVTASAKRECPFLGTSKGAIPPPPGPCTTGDDDRDR